MAIGMPRQFLQRTSQALGCACIVSSGRDDQEHSYDTEDDSEGCIPRTSEPDHPFAGRGACFSEVQALLEVGFVGPVKEKAGNTDDDQAHEHHQERTEGK